MPTGTFTITPNGPFSLAEAAMFGFGQRAGQSWDGIMRLAFCLDSYTSQVGVEVRQDDSGAGTAGEVQCVFHSAGFDSAGFDSAGFDSAGPAAAGQVRRQVARVLSLDHDATGFAQIGQRDPVIGQLQAAAPGLRPPLFYSPYEAAAWSVLSARRPAGQMMGVRQRLSEAHGAVFNLAGQALAALPTPSQLLGVGSFPGIPADKMRRLHGVARAALDGRLDAAHLTGLGPARAMTELQAIEGIGPFYSALIVIRGTGFTDVLPVNEPQALDLAARLYQLPARPSEAEFRALAEPWRPFRTWAVVLIRAAAWRILGVEPPTSAHRQRNLASRPSPTAPADGPG